MTDEHLIEISERQVSQQLAAAIAAAQSKAHTRTMDPLGECYECGDAFAKTDKLRDKKLFCDRTCADAWEVYEQAQARKHGHAYR